MLHTGSAELEPCGNKVAKTVDTFNDVSTTSSSDYEDYTADFIDGTESFVMSEVHTIVDQLCEAFKSLSDELKKPNILLIGKTGAGKSSLINAVFGRKCAAIGTGEPVTKHLEKYAPADKPVVVYDSRGLEHGSSAEFVNEMSAFIEERRAHSDIRQHIHVAWFLIDLSHARFQSFESELCRTVLRDIPVFFVLNKADTADLQQLSDVKDLVLNQNLENCRGVFEVVADRINYSPQHCPVCKNDNFRFRQKTKQLLCDEDDCGVVVTLSQTYGLEPLIQQTTLQLPLLTREAFVKAQQISEKERLIQAKGIITVYASGSARLRRSKNTAKSLVHMATRLALLWGLELFPSIVTQEIAHHYYDQYSHNSLMKALTTLLSDILSSRRLSEALFIATGAEICRMLYAMRMSAVNYAVSCEEGINMKDAEPIFKLEITDSFLNSISNGIKHHPLDSVISELLDERVQMSVEGI